MALRKVMLLSMIATIAAQSSGEDAALVINEVSASGVEGFCNGDDWVEIALPAGSTPLNISGYMLCDSDGCSDNDAYTFAQDTIINPGDYLAVCHLAPMNRTHRRWIGVSDTITLYSDDGRVLDTSGPMGGFSNWSQTWARSPDVRAPHAPRPFPHSAPTLPPIYARVCATSHAGRAIC